MMTPLVLAFLWLIAANLIAMFPSRDQHWRNAYFLIAAGVPILGWLTWTFGPVWGLIVLAGAASVFRWPLIHLWKWARRRIFGAEH